MEEMRTKKKEMFSNRITRKRLKNQRRQYNRSIFVKIINLYQGTLDQSDPKKNKVLLLSVFKQIFRRNRKERNNL